MLLMVRLRRLITGLRLITLSQYLLTSGLNLKFIGTGQAAATGGAAIDGQVIVDHHGPNMGDYNLPITRIFVSNPYSGGNVSVDNHMTGLEIWNDFPCGAGVSCFDADSIAPTVPASLLAALKTITTTTNTSKGKGKTKSSSSAQVTLSWNASSDNVAVAGYNIYRNGTKIAVSTSTGYTDSLGVATGSVYSYTVKAFDAAGNISTASNVASIVN
jgi:hypothetical protein